MVCLFFIQLWSWEEEEGSCSNFKHDEAAILSNGILINGKAVVEDIARGEKELREMEEIEEGRRRGGGGGAPSNFKHDEIIVLINNF